MGLLEREGGRGRVSSSKEEEEEEKGRKADLGWRWSGRYEGQHGPSGANSGDWWWLRQEEEERRRNLRSLMMVTVAMADPPLMKIWVGGYGGGHISGGDGYGRRLR
uniref:Uncharacterized protein n=1 Tax=Populus alba TaxID=43335 RepID=A0A4V6AB50_POPAL|nr:hypothetical protein D5086_0000073790 [Populus alba]